MIMELLGHKDYIRVLMAVEEKPRRFGGIQKALELNPAQLDRALDFLREGLWIIPQTVPAKSGRILIEYHLGKRGKAFLQAFRTFQQDAKRLEMILGHSVVAELQSLYE